MSIQYKSQTSLTLTHAHSKYTLKGSLIIKRFSELGQFIKP